MQPYQERVAQEKRELDEKISKLDEFIGSMAYNGLPAEDQDLLREQLGHMKAYCNILDQRIARFGA